MATVSFIDKLKSMKMTKFSFVKFERSISTSEDETKITLLKFTLQDPLDRVTSTGFEYHPATNERVHPFDENVEFVMCKLSDIEKYQTEFTFEEDTDGGLTGAGTYHGDMFFDLAKSSMQTWLTDTKFSTLSKQWKDNKRSEKFGRFLNKKD